MSQKIKVKKLTPFHNFIKMIVVTGILFHPFQFSFAGEKMKKIAEHVFQLQQQHDFSNVINPFTIHGFNSDIEISKVLKNYTLLNDMHSISSILTTQPEYLKLNIPYGNETLSLLLYKVNISPNGLTILTGSGRNTSEITMVNYRGIINNDYNSVASISFSENEIMGLVSNKDGNFVLGKLENNPADLYVFYNDKDLIPQNTFACATQTDNLPKSQTQDISHNKSGSINCVNWYWETDYDIFVGKGTVALVTTYMNGIFNQVSTLYDNDGMTINLQTLFIWDVTDPYIGPSTGNYLSQFGTNRTSFAGDLANLFGYNGGGGVAYVNSFCSNTNFRMGYCGISSSFQTVPTYSWTVEVTAHEEGHLFGSQHTHDCVWNNNNTKIDACGDDEGYPSGTCPLTNPVLPVGGGTIMSYCHLSNVGINFSFGFGPQPTARMLNEVNTSSCLGACNGCPTPAQPGSISGNVNVCLSSSQSYSVAAVSGATSYTWTLPSGWSGSSLTNTITVSAGAGNGAITVKANNSCGSGPVRNLTVSVNPLPPLPGAITAIGGNTKVCPGSVKNYHINLVSGATSYTWIPPTGASITNGQGTHNATVTFNTGFLASDSLRVTTNNSCGSSPSKSIFITRKNPSIPSAITGQSSSLCNLSGIPHSVTPVSGITYNWSFNTGNAVVASGQGTNSITANYNAGFTNGILTVTANNACGSSSPKTLAVKSVPATPGSISGSTTVCANQQGVPYSIPAVSGATSYTWSGPNGIRFSDGITTSTTTVFTTLANAVTANFKTTAGTIKVKANNNCGSGSNKKLTFSFTCKESLVETNDESVLLLSPNPVNDMLLVSFAKQTNESYTIALKDLTGRTLLTITNKSVDTQVNEKLNLSKFSAGLYFVDVTVNDIRKTKRVVKN